jgi:hypothetical protein
MTDVEDATEPYKEKYKNMQEANQRSPLFITSLLFPLCHALHIVHSPPSQFSARNNSTIPIHTSTNIFRFLNH